MPRNFLTGGAFRSQLFSELLTPDATPPSLEPGAHVGVWRIERMIGRGGMSEVYLARRDAEDFEQAVAIKLIAADSEASDFVRSERRILGQLRHPAIATLIDGGELASGRVWFAMEYVEGEPIDAYVESRRLPWSECARLVERLCDAVSHAHAHLLVHRDIKPSNVLVDAQGNPKLIDFGIAVAAHGQAAASKWMTPGFAAPEQIDGHAVTTATDIFQLGRLLDVLIQAADSERPAPTATARDLQRIVQRATRDETAERYASAAELRDDLAALRGFLPLRAQGSGASQRLRLWRQRHPWTPWLAAPLLLALTASGVMLYRSAAREAAESAMALREEQVSTALGSFFVDLFNEPVTAPNESGGVAALLDRGQRRLLSRPHAVPEVQAALLHGLAQVNASMERRAMALELYEEAARVQRREGLDLPLAQTLAALAWMRGIGGDTAAAERLANEAAGRLERDTRPGRDRYLALIALSQYYAIAYDFPRATQLLDQALSVGRQRYGEESPELFRALQLQSANLQNQWLVAQALPLGTELVERCDRQFGADDSRCIAALTHLQRARALAGDTRAARATYAQLWAQRDGWEGTMRHYNTHAVLFGLADVEWLEGDYEAARRTLLSSLCELKRAQSTSGPHWISDRGALALILLDLGAVRAALQVSSEAKAAFAAELSGSLEQAHWAVRQARIELANGALDPDTQALLQTAVERLRAIYGARSHFAARAEYALAAAYALQGRDRDALALLDQAARSDAGGLHYFHAELVADIELTRARLSDDAAVALVHLTRAREGLLRALGPEHPKTASTTIRVAQALAATAAAMPSAEVTAAYRVLSQRLVADAPDLVAARALVPASEFAPASPAGVAAEALDALSCD